MFIVGSFRLDKQDFDQYGLKVAMNDIILVETQAEWDTFLVQFAPYNYTSDSLQCSLDYVDPNHYVYAVGVGVLQNTSNGLYFFVIGEVTSEGLSAVDHDGNNGSFVGIWINQDPKSVSDYITTGLPLSCDFFKPDRFNFISNYKHQDFFIMAIHPYGQYAIGLATDFVFLYYPFPSPNITTKAKINIWPNNSTYRPIAADASDSFTIVAGFIENSARSRVRATPTVYLISNSNLTVLKGWSYSAPNNSWQSRLTYNGAELWSKKFMMSVNVNSADSIRVLVGMPFLNTVFLFVVGNNGTTLTLTDSRENDSPVGFGKSVTWLTSSHAAILSSIYSSDYTTWFSSRVFMYTSMNSITIPSTPSAIFPSAQQPKPSTISDEFIQVISSPASLAILDLRGGILVIIPESPGYYASTDTTNAVVAASMPVISHRGTCLSGTYKADTGIYPCILCPSGYHNPGNLPAASCLSCSSESFCPLGAVYQINLSTLVGQSQAYPYPRSPETDNYEDILLANMLAIGSNSHCLLVSSLFWTIIATAFASIIVIVTFLLSKLVRPSEGMQIKKKVKEVFRRTDLVGEGELWLGGLASIAIIVMSIKAWIFAISYLNQYPSEKVGDSTFACDMTIRNAKFFSSLQPLAVLPSKEEQDIFSMLDEQNFTLHLEFINTIAACSKLKIAQIVGSSLVSLPYQSCNSTNGTLGILLSLPNHVINLVVTIDDIQLIGAIRIGFSGSGFQNGSNTLRQLDFRQTFSGTSISRTLSQTAAIQIDLTKSLNETEPLSNSDSDFSGIWYPTFVVNLNQMFINADDYITLTNRTSSILNIDIIETTYYIKNVQSPIAKQAEVIFRTLLFTFLCLEIFAMTFLLTKLFLVPLYKKLVQFCKHFCSNRHQASAESEPQPDYE